MFIGRAGEVEALRAAVADAALGRPSAVLLAGEAGVGKSRLLAEVVAGLPEGAIVLVGHCVELGQGELPYAPIAAALRALVAQLEDGELDAVLGPGRAELARLVPALGTPIDGASEVGQARLFELLLGTLERLGKRRPVVLVLEDVHWADGSTRDLLGFLVRSLRSERIALLVSYRSDDLHRRHPLRPLLAELERDPRVRRMALARFSREELAEQVAAITGAPAVSDVVERLYVRSEGNAFFTEELLAAAPAGGMLPDSLRDALIVRLERLSDAAQQVVRVAAAVGRRVDHRLLAAVARFADDELLGALREAVAAQVLVADPRGGTYAFRHALLREVAYEDLLPGEREALHVALARALEARPDLAGSGVTLASELAYHWHAAREPELAVPASIRAAAEAEHLYAYAEAERHLTRALELWSSVSDQARGGLDEVELVRRAAEAAQRSGDAARAVALARRAITLLDPAIDPRRAGMLQERLARYLFEAGRADQAPAHLALAVQFLEGAPSAEWARALAVEGQMHMLAGRVGESSAALEQALALARAVGARDVEVNVLASRAATLSATGRHDDGVAAGRAAIVLAEELGAWDQLLRAYVNTAESLDRSGRPHDALALTLEGLEAGQRIGIVRLGGGTLHGEIAARQIKLGRFDEAQRTIAGALRLGANGVGMVALQEHRAVLAARRGDGEGVRAALAAGAGGSTQASGGMWFGEGAAAAAEVALWDGDEAAALEAVDAALAPLGSEWLMYTAPLYALGARAHADRAERARALRRDPGGAGDAAAALAERFDARLATSDAGPPPPETLAWRAQVEAERGRLRGDDATPRWRAAREGWERLEYAYLAAVCAWREADAILRVGGDRAAAAELLRGALKAASAMGARPLGGEIEALARRARLDLAAPGAGGPAADSAADELGLTAREVEVLRMVAAGQTNRQIGTELYISGKTASVHVSRILAKLGAANRSEAGAIARTLGLEQPEPGGPE